MEPNFKNKASEGQIDDLRFLLSCGPLLPDSGGLLNEGFT